MTASDATTAPVAPGRLGQPIPAAELLRYLDELRRWLDARRAELDRIDAAALRSATPDAYTGDLTLALAMWQAATERMQALLVAWDSGRVDAAGREGMSRVIWASAGPPATAGRGGRGPAVPGLGVSLVEACRLCDALTSTLRSRLGFDPSAADVAARVTAVRAGLYRCEELLAHRARGAADPGVDTLRRRLDDLASTAARGADVSGPLAVLEATVARAERDLIMAAATHADLGRDYRAALQRRQELVTEAGQVRELAALCTDRIADPPRLAVPEPSALGDIPQTRAELSAYAARQESVAAALRICRDAYAAPLAERDELRGRLQAFAAKARARGRSADPAVAAAYEQARAVLWSAPCALPRARALVTAYQQLTNRPLTPEPVPDAQVPKIREPGAPEPAVREPGAPEPAVREPGAWEPAVAVNDVPVHDATTPAGGSAP